MIGLITGALGRFWKYIAIAVAAIAGILFIRQSAKNEGRAQERAKQNERVLDAKEKMDSVPEHSSSDIDDKLRSGKF